ncbi:hypothetical protein [Mycolicibacterium sp. S3B2]|uniref:hypothetical protein n=2 Tax=Mycolicibacterium sp. S3B2 TaxID=3415120 RepID=UPI003C7CE9A1
MKSAVAIAAAAGAILTAAPAQACECAGLWENQMVCDALRDPATSDVTVASWLATREGLVRDVPSYTAETVTAIIAQEVPRDCPELAAGVDEAISRYQSAPYPTREHWEAQAQAQLGRVGWAPLGGVQ